MAKKKFNFSFGLVIPIFALLIVFLLALFFFSKNFLLSQTLQKSTASFSIKGSNLKIEFDILNKDQERAKKLSKSLGVDTSWQKGIEIGLESFSLEWLENRLPLKAYLDFEENSLKFNSGPFYTLNNALPEEKMNFSTGAGNLNLTKKRNGDFSLRLKEPEVLLFYATSSGKLKLSEKIQILFPIINKIDTIDITLQEKNIKGRVSLKD